MAQYSLGKITVAGGGTSVVLTTNSGASTPARIYAYMIEALPTNTGAVYITKVATGTDDRSNMNGMLAILPPPTTNVIPSFSASIAFSEKAVFADSLDPSKIYVDVAVNGEGVIASVLHWT